jgi:hypothetical protein
VAVSRSSKSRPLLLHSRCEGEGRNQLRLTLTSDRRGDEALGNEAATADDEEGGMGGEHMILENSRDIMKEFVLQKANLINQSGTAKCEEIMKRRKRKGGRSGGDARNI